MNNKTKQKTHNIKGKRFFGELVKLPNGKYKAYNFQELVQKNQYKKSRRWVDCNSRELARDLNNSGIIIK